MTKGNAARTWRTEEVRFLDDETSSEGLVRSFEGRAIGTGRPTDGRPAAVKLKGMVQAELESWSGPHTETVLTTLGALAGFSVQMALREEPEDVVGMPEARRFVPVETKSGDRYFFGDLINDGLFGDGSNTMSVLALTTGAAQAAGARELPDFKEIVKHVTMTVGSDGFGRLTVPSRHTPDLQPIELLNRFWNPIRNLLANSVQRPLHWPMTLALAGQITIVEARTVIDPALAFRIVMEAAIMMAKVDPDRIHRARFRSSGSTAPPTWH